MTCERFKVFLTFGAKKGKKKYLEFKKGICFEKAQQMLRLYIK